MGFFNKNITNNDMVAKKNLIQEEGNFHLSLSSINYIPEKIELINGTESKTNEMVVVEFFDTNYNEYAMIRYYKYLFNNLNNLFEYMIDKGVFKISNNFSVDEWEKMTIEQKVKLLNSFPINNSVRMGIRIKMSVSSSGKEFYNAEIDEKTEYEVKEKEAEKYIDEELPF